MIDQQTIDWLHGLAEKGGRGVVNNIDARCLGRIADDIEVLRAENGRLSNNRDMWKGQVERQAERLSSLQWRHIHTAPKDGTEILLFGPCRPSNSKSRYARDANVGWWQGDHWTTRVAGEVCDAVLWMPIPDTQTVEPPPGLAHTSHDGKTP